MNLLDYPGLFATNALSGFMKATESRWVALGPGLQVVRGLIFALALWPFKQIFLHEDKGWLKLWLLFVGLGILSTFGPALGSIDGLIYTTVPMYIQASFLPELLLQSLLLSLGLCYWYAHPKKSFNFISVVLLILILLMSLAGFLASEM